LGSVGWLIVSLSNDHPRGSINLTEAAIAPLIHRPRLGGSRVVS